MDLRRQGSQSRIRELFTRFVFCPYGRWDHRLGAVCRETRDQEVLTGASDRARSRTHETTSTLREWRFAIVNMLIIFAVSIGAWPSAAIATEGAECHRQFKFNAFMDSYKSMQKAELLLKTERLGSYELYRQSADGFSRHWRETSCPVSLVYAAYVYARIDSYSDVENALNQVARQVKDLPERYLSFYENIKGRLETKRANERAKVIVESKVLQNIRPGEPSPEVSARAYADAIRRRCEQLRSSAASAFSRRDDNSYQECVSELVVAERAASNLEIFGPAPCGRATRPREARRVMECLRRAMLGELHELPELQPPPDE